MTNVIRAEESTMSPGIRKEQSNMHPSQSTSNATSNKPITNSNALLRQEILAQSRKQAELKRKLEESLQGRKKATVGRKASASSKNERPVQELSRNEGPVDYQITTNVVRAGESTMSPGIRKEQSNIYPSPSTSRTILSDSDDQDEVIHRKTPLKRRIAIESESDESDDAVANGDLQVPEEVVSTEEESTLRLGAGVLGKEPPLRHSEAAGKPSSREVATQTTTQEDLKAFYELLKLKCASVYVSRRFQEEIRNRLQGHAHQELPSTSVTVPTNGSQGSAEAVHLQPSVPVRIESVPINDSQGSAEAVHLQPSVPVRTESVPIKSVVPTETGPQGEEVSKISAAEYVKRVQAEKREERARKKAEKMAAKQKTVKPTIKIEIKPTPDGSLSHHMESPRSAVKPDAGHMKVDQDCNENAPLLAPMNLFLRRCMDELEQLEKEDRGEFYKAQRDLFEIIEKHTRK